MSGLTQRQAGCLQAIRDLTIDGVSPSLAELAAHLHTGAPRVHEMLHALKDRGKITWAPRKARSVLIIADHVAPAILDQLSDQGLRLTIAHASGLLAQRAGGGRSAGDPAADSRQVAGRIASGGDLT